jgi:hypothetical protein
MQINDSISTKLDNQYRMPYLIRYYLILWRMI